MTDLEIEKWAKHFKRKKEFPCKKVNCTKCNKPITLLGDNLLKRIEKYNSPENLLRKIECRTCLYLVKNQQKEKIKKVKKEKKEKKEEILKKRYIYIPKDNEIILLKDNPKYTAELTKTECWRPDIFLDNDRSCNECSLHKMCQCPIKRLRDEKIKQREEKQIKRK